MNMIRLKPVKSGQVILIVNDRKSLPLLFLTRVILEDFQGRDFSFSGSGGEFILQSSRKSALGKALGMIPESMYREVNEQAEWSVSSSIYEPTKENTWGKILRKGGAFWALVHKDALPYFSKSRDFRLLVQTHMEDLYAII